MLPNIIIKDYPTSPSSLSLVVSLRVRKFIEFSLGKPNLVIRWRSDTPHRYGLDFPERDAITKQVFRRGSWVSR